MAGTRSDFAVEAGINAWDEGYRIIVSWFNVAFEASKITLRISAEPPPPRITLDDCRRRLSNTLLEIRPHCPDLPSDKELYPWVVGYLNTSDGRKGKCVGGIVLQEGAFAHWGSADAIKYIVAVKHRCGWRNGRWRSYVVRPMEDNSKAWREWLQQFRSSRGKRRGRPKPAVEILKDESELVARWQHVRSTGVYKAHFARSIGMSQREFNKLLDRVAQRKRRSGE